MSSDFHREFGCVVTAPDESRSRRPGGGPHDGFAVSLANFLLFLVPMFISELRTVPVEQIEHARESALDQIASHGDALQFGGQARGSSRVSLAKAFAILARAEGGVTALGVHACLRPHEGCPGPHSRSDTSTTPRS